MATVRSAFPVTATHHVRTPAPGETGRWPVRSAHLGQQDRGPLRDGLPGCGDDPGWDWSEISKELRKIPGIYRTKEKAEAALMDHIGMQTRK